MKVLLTGADGFLGSNITRELLLQGHQVKAFQSLHKHTSTLVDLPIEQYHGDILNKQDLNVAMQGCDAVIHAAASTSVWPTRNPNSWKINVEGTRLLIKACLEQKIKRIVYVGTANSFGFGTNLEPGNETKEYSCGKYHLDYMDSKYEAQQLILQAVRENQLPALLVNPCFMFGPYDTQPGPGAMIVSVCKNQIPGYSSGGRNYAAVKDVANAIVNALTMGRIGECYILGNANLSYHEIFDIIAKQTNSKQIKFNIPSLFVKFYGLLNSVAGNLSRWHPNVSYPLSRIACDTHYYSSEKAVKELALNQSEIATAVKESYDWMKANGKLN